MTARKAQQILGDAGPRYCEVALGLTADRRRAATFFYGGNIKGGRITLGTDPEVIGRMIADLQAAKDYLEESTR